jgi:hypothetical protein
MFRNARSANGGNDRWFNDVRFTSARGGKAEMLRTAANLLCCTNHLLLC